MSSLKAVFFFIIELIGIFLLHTAVGSFLPYPLDKINVAYLFLMWCVVYKNNPQFLWLALILSFVIDLYSDTSFGILGAAFLISLVITRVLFFVIFSDYSWYNILMLGIIGMFCYQLLTFVFQTSVLIFNRHLSSIQLPNFYPLLVELIINTGVFFAAYLVKMLFFQKKIRWNAI